MDMKTKYPTEDCQLFLGSNYLKWDKQTWIQNTFYAYCEDYVRHLYTYRYQPEIITPNGFSGVCSLIIFIGKALLDFYLSYSKNRPIKFGFWHQTTNSYIEPSTYLLKIYSLEGKRKASKYTDFYSKRQILPSKQTKLNYRYFTWMYFKGLVQSTTSHQDGNPKANQDHIICMYFLVEYV